MKTSQIREPIRKKWIWIVLTFITLGIVPWYFPASATEPYILGFPLWAFISAIFSLALCGFLSWLCLTQWNIVEEEEEAAKTSGGSGAYSDVPENASNSAKGDEK